MRIIIVGSGAMGRLFGVRLAGAGHEIVMVDALESVVNDIRAHGIALRVAGVETRIAVGAGLAASVHGPADAILLFTKTMHSEKALESVGHLIGESTVGVSVQNGLGNESPLLPWFGADRTVIGMTDYAVDRGGDGVVTAEPTGTVTLGALHPVAVAHARYLVDRLNHAGIVTRFHPEIKVPIWEKVVFNAALNTISAATGLTVGVLGEDERARRLVEAVLVEAVAVAHAEGLNVDSEVVRAKIEWAFQNHADHKTSMLVDIEHGRQTEIDGIGGAIVASGANREVATPVLGTLSDVVRLKSVAARG